MKILIKLLTSSLILGALLGCTQTETTTPDIALLTQANILNLKPVAPKVFASGQPSQEQINVVSQAGIKHIINLRPSSEQDWDESAYVNSLGMQYHNLPVAGAQGVTYENAQELTRLLKQFGDEPVLVHCSSGNRVGALIALSEYDKNGLDVEAALVEGRRWGLTGLEDDARNRMQGK